LKITSLSFGDFQNFVLKKHNNVSLLKRNYAIVELKQKHKSKI